MGTNLWIALWLVQTLLGDLAVIEPEGADSELTRVIVESYRAAVGDVDARDDGAQSRWYARVTWDESKLHARIEIRRGSADADVEGQRNVEFSETDDLEQRHRAVGLIIAAHVLASTHAREVPAATAPAPAAPSTEDANAAPLATHEPEPLRLPAFGADLALLAGPALDRGAPRFGVMLRGFARPFELPIAGIVSLRATRRFEAPEVTTWSANAGLLLRLQPRASALALELRAEAVVQRTQAEAEDAQSARSESAGAWRAGGQLGLEAHARITERVSLFVGAELQLLRPAVHLEVGGREIGVERALGGAALAGVRYAH